MHCLASLSLSTDGLNVFRSTTIFIPFDYNMFQTKLDESFNMFKLPTSGGRYNLFINAFKMPNILDSNRNIKAYSNLIKRCVKNVPIT